MPAFASKNRLLAWGSAVATSLATASALVFGGCEQSPSPKQEEPATPHTRRRDLGATFPFDLMGLESRRIVESERHARRLVLVGGGKTPTEAISQFMEWAGDERAKILFVPWSSPDPDYSFRRFKELVREYKPAEVHMAPLHQDMERKRNEFIDSLPNYTGIWWSGGDQNNCFEVFRMPSVREAILAECRKGTVLGGSSAGTAIMSEVALTGDPAKNDPSLPGTDKGLGVVPGFVLDQHFVKRGRLGRLDKVLRGRSEKGLGIDENGAVSVFGSSIQVIGPMPAVLLEEPDMDGKRTPIYLNPGEVIETADSRPSRWGLGSLSLHK